MPQVTNMASMKQNIRTKRFKIYYTFFNTFLRWETKAEFSVNGQDVFEVVERAEKWARVQERLDSLGYTRYTINQVVEIK